MNAHKRVNLRLNLRYAEVGADTVGVRRVREGVADDHALADLMNDSYRGTIDEERDHSLESCMREIERTRRGVYGTFLTPKSFVVESRRLLAAASLVTLWQGVPLLAFLMTASAFKRRGFARAAFGASVKALCDDGYRRIDLVVTEANTPATTLYERLGFEAAEYLD